MLIKIMRLDRDPEFRKQTFKRFNDCCCFKPSLVPKWSKKKEDEGLTIPPFCNKTDDLMIYRKDGDVSNNSDENILIFCKRHYYIVFHELRDMVKRLRDKSAGIRKHEKIKVTLTNEEFESMIKVAENEKQRMLLKLLFYLGGRVTETILLQSKDIHLDVEKPYIRFKPENTKRNVERIVPIPHVLIENLKEYVAGKDYLFSFSKQRAWQIVKRCTKKANIDKDIHPHSFRHTYGSNVFEHTGDLKIVQSLLGHKNLNTTSIYAHVSEKQKQQTVDDVFK